MTLTYADALDALQARGRFGIQLGLGRTRALLRGLGDPQLGFRGALVGGTNGKGSVLALAAASVRAAGLRAGETPKPHLVSYRERLRVGGALVDGETFARLVERVLEVATTVDRRLGPPTEFELLTAATFAWFAEVGVDLALVEVGLGGRLDATHAWDGGVAAITNVALDHMDRLGPTIPDIAREKAAIIMPGDRAVTGADGPGLAVVRRRARRVGVPLVVVAPAPLLGQDRDGIIVELPRLGPTRVGLRGRHQAANVAVAEALLDALEEAGIARVPDEARRAGYAAACWPGRLELIEASDRSGGVEVLLDGAHNPAGAGALATALDDLTPDLVADRPLTLLIAVMADKDVDGVVRALAGTRRMERASVVATQVSARSLPAAELAARWAAVGTVASAEAIPDVAAAWDRARSLAAGHQGLLVVAGSLYLVGAVRARLIDDPATRDPVRDPSAPDRTAGPARATVGRGLETTVQGEPGGAASPGGRPGRVP